MGSCCSKSAVGTEDVKEPKSQQPSLLLTAPAPSFDECMAPTPAAALILEALLRHRNTYITPSQLLQELLESEEQLTNAVHPAQSGSALPPLVCRTPRLVCSPTRYLQTAREAECSLPADATVRPKTHRGSIDGEAALQAQDASPFGPLSHFITARSHPCLSAKKSGPQCFRIATESQQSEGDYSYSETVWSRIESQNSSEWEYEYGGSWGAGVDCAPDFANSSSGARKPIVPSLNMALVAALAARENGYIRSRRPVHPISSPSASTLRRNEMPSRCSVADRRVVTERELLQPRTSRCYVQKSTRTHRYRKDEMFDAPEPEQAFDRPPTARSKTVHFEDEHVSSFTDRPAVVKFRSFCGPSNLCTFRPGASSQVMQNLSDAAPIDSIDGLTEKSSSCDAPTPVNHNSSTGVTDVSTTFTVVEQSRGSYGKAVGDRVHTDPAAHPTGNRDSPRRAASCESLSAAFPFSQSLQKGLSCNSMQFDCSASVFV